VAEDEAVLNTVHRKEEKKKKEEKEKKSLVRYRVADPHSFHPDPAPAF
jgi:hypothetical protein